MAHADLQLEPQRYPKARRLAQLMLGVVSTVFLYDLRLAVGAERVPPQFLPAESRFVSLESAYELEEMPVSERVATLDQETP